MMPEISILAILAAAIIPNLVGAIYFGPLFGKTWLASLGFTAEDMQNRNEALIYGNAFLLSIVIAFFLKINIEMFHKDVGTTGELVFSSFHTFAHGALHGSIFAMTLVIPVVVCLGLFQKQGAKNILLNTGFWLICFALMGGILDFWS